jgi:hypothetical protein
MTRPNPTNEPASPEPEPERGLADPRTSQPSPEGIFPDPREPARVQPPTKPDPSASHEDGSADDASRGVVDPRSETSGPDL